MAQISRGPLLLGRRHLGVSMSTALFNDSLPRLLPRRTITTTSSPPSLSNRILIVGGGISGLALAQGLRKHAASSTSSSPTFTVFERDASSTGRSQGYRLGINFFGTQSLEKVLPSDLMDLFRRTSVDTMNNAMGGRFNALDRENKPEFGTAFNIGLRVMRYLYSWSPVSLGGLGLMIQTMTKPYSTDRSVLRSILQLDLGDSVQYNKRCTGYSVVNVGEEQLVRAEFDDGTTELGGLLVGADGVNSVISKSLFAAEGLPLPDLLDIERRCVYGKTPLTPELEQALPEKFRTGLCTYASPANITTSLFLDPMHFPVDVSEASGGRLPPQSNYIYWVFSAEREAFGMPKDSELLAVSSDRAAQFTLDMTQGWDPVLRKLLELQDKSKAATLRIVSSRSQLAERPANRLVTLMGDAAHAMSPTGGSGANTGLLDAATLAEEIGAKGLGLECVKAYESRMREHAERAIALSFFGVKSLWAGKEEAEYQPYKWE